MPNLKLYATGSATANAVAQVIIPSASTISAIQCAIWYDSVTDNANCELELSKASAREIGVNGAQQCICEIAMGGNFVTSGLAHYANNLFLPVAIRVVQGQIIYLHALIGGTITYTATFIIWYG